MSQTLEKRSPLKSALLRNPGQSLDEEIDRLLMDKAAPYIYGTAMFLVIAWMEWWRWYLSSPPQPLVLTAIALITVLVTARKLVAIRRQIRQLKLARDGERAVGQYLEQLREQGYRVLHDLVGDGFNVDHVLIGPAGVFTVETKTSSKPAKGKTAIEDDGEPVTINGYKPERDPLVQGKAQAHWLGGLLQETTGRRFAVRSLVLYPGGLVKLLSPGAALDVRVLVVLQKCWYSTLKYI